MSTTKCAWSCALVLLVTTASTSAGPLTGVNLLVNGEFEDDAPGTPEPTGWTLWTSAPAGWQGVTQYESTNGHPQQRPDGQAAPSNCYGTVLTWYDTGYGTIVQVVDIGTPGEGPVQAWVGGWVYTADLEGAFVQFALHQPATQAMWLSEFIYEVGSGDG